MHWGAIALTLKSDPRMENPLWNKFLFIPS